MTLWHRFWSRMSTISHWKIWLVHLLFTRFWHDGFLWFQAIFGLLLSSEALSFLSRLPVTKQSSEAESAQILPVSVVSAERFILLPVPVETNSSKPVNTSFLRWMKVLILLRWCCRMEICRPATVILTSLVVPVEILWGEWNTQPL